MVSFLLKNRPIGFWEHLFDLKTLWLLWACDCMVHCQFWGFLFAFWIWICNVLLWGENLFVIFFWNRNAHLLGFCHFTFFFYISWIFLRLKIVYCTILREIVFKSILLVNLNPLKHLQDLPNKFFAYRFRNLTYFFFVKAQHSVLNFHHLTFFSKSWNLSVILMKETESEQKSCKLTVCMVRMSQQKYIPRLTTFDIGKKPRLLMAKNRN